jgi:hypothetical protein
MDAIEAGMAGEAREAVQKVASGLLPALRLASKLTFGTDLVPSATLMLDICIFRATNRLPGVPSPHVHFTLNRAAPGAPKRKITSMNTALPTARLMFWKIPLPWPN